jgi:hypothetical protein
MENIGLFYGHMVYFIAIWYIFWPFAILYGYLVYISPFWYVVPQKIWQPCRRRRQKEVVLSPACSVPTGV